MSDPTFTEDEGRRILARAAERQEALERAALGEGGSMTLDELASIAREAEIDVELVRAEAADALLRRDAEEPASTLGLPHEVVATRLIPGPVSDGAWERMVPLLRETFGQGVASRYGRIREWTSTTGLNDAPVVVRLEPGEDGTVVRFTRSNKGRSLQMIKAASGFAAFGLVFVILGALGAGEGALPFGALATGLGVLTGLVSLAAGRSASARDARSFEAVADKLELIARSDD